MERPSYICPKCHRESHHPEDIKQFYCGACHVFAEDLRNEVVTELDQTGQKEPITRRDCYSVAILTLFQQCDHAEARLVHAYVRNSFDGNWTEHAWCETPASATYEDGSQGRITVVIDYTQPDTRVRILPRDIFYERIQVREPIKRFTLQEAIAKALEVGHDGPWP